MIFRLHAMYISVAVLGPKLHVGRVFVPVLHSGHMNMHKGIMGEGVCTHSIPLPPCTPPPIPTILKCLLHLTP